jgi:hypothetical protein
MKTLLLASAIVACAGIGSAFASVTIYTDGTTWDPAGTAAHSKAMCPVPATPAQGSCASTMDAAPWLSHMPKVVRWGPPDGGQGVGG